jgi:hypothetical protein
MILLFKPLSNLTKFGWKTHLILLSFSKNQDHKICVPFRPFDKPEHHTTDLKPY